jgi:hypothetical protein
VGVLPSTIGETMGALLSLLPRLGTFSNGLANLINSIVMAFLAYSVSSDLQALRSDLQKSLGEQKQIAQAQPPPNEELEILYAQFRREMDAVYQMELLHRIILTLPALPEETN